MDYMIKCALALVLACTMACGSSQSVGSSAPSLVATPELPSKFNRCEQYAETIKQFTGRYLTWDWRWVAAQIYQESLCDTRAVSRVGAQGLGQFMPGTWFDMTKALGWRNVSPFAAKPNIQATALYMSKQRATWDRRGRQERHMRQLAQAGYNAGKGNILKAQRKCNDARDWPDINPCLIDVTGPANSHETITYVSRISRWKREMSR